MSLRVICRFGIHMQSILKSLGRPDTAVALIHRIDHEEVHFIFMCSGATGRTGHDHQNRFIVTNSGMVGQDRDANSRQFVRFLILAQS